MHLIADRYELGDLIGSGGFASVYRARDVELDRAVAVKLIADAETNPALAERFRHEALALSQLACANVARVYDFGRDERRGLYLVMELIEGVSLDVYGLGRPLSESEVMIAGRALLSALSAAHASGIVHRDIKPENVIVPGGLAGLSTLKVLDFGIARQERRSEIRAAVGTTDTLEGQAIGTPAYMAPEQIVADVVGPAADIYSAGLVLFELLDRGPLHAAATPREQLVRRITDEPDLSGRVGPDLAALLSRMLARDPAQRFPDGTAALLAFASSSPASQGRLVASEMEHAHTEIGSKLMSVAPPGSRRTLPQDRSTRELARLWALDRDARVAFTQALLDLDLPMLDALARRERGHEMGIVSGAVAAALRLDLQRAVELLAPELERSELAQAVATTLVAPTARPSITDRVDADHSDAWVGRIDPVVGAALCGVWFSLGGRDHMERVNARCLQLADRLSGVERERLRLIGRFAAAMIGNEPMARVIADARADIVAPSTALAAFIRSHGLGVVAFRADEHLAREQFEVACRVGVDTGAVLLEVRSLTAWSGALLSARPEQALRFLHRATTLLSGGDATRLEQMAALNLGSALAVARRHAEAIPYLEQAHALGHEDGRHENAALAAASLLHSSLTRDDEALLARARDRVSIALDQEITLRARAYGETGLALLSARHGDLERAAAEIDAARAHGKEAGLGGTDAWLIAEVVALVIAIARGEKLDLLERAGALEHSASTLGFVSFYWFDALVDALEHVPDPELRQRLLSPAKRLVMLLNPQSRV